MGATPTRIPLNYKMNISVDQYRCSIGRFNVRCGSGRGPNYNSIYQCNVYMTFYNLLTKQNNYIPVTDTGISVFKVIFLFLYYNLINILVAVHINNVKSDTLIQDRIDHNMEYILPEYNVLNSSISMELINFAVIILMMLTPHHNSIKLPFDKGTYIPNVISVIWSRKFYHKGKGGISKNLCFYISSINIILIVITTPCIVNPGPPTHSRTTNLKVSYCNCQGLIFASSMKSKQPIFQTNKLLDFQTYLHHDKPDIVVINESWLNANIHNNEIVDEQYYKMFRLDRTSKDMQMYNKVGGGGLFILVKQDLDIEVKLVPIKCELPIISLELKFKDLSKICLSSFYRWSIPQ